MALAEADLRAETLPIPEVDKDWLRQIAASKRPELPDISQLPRLARFFDTNLVLSYRNGETWYDVHPLIRDDLAPAGPAESDSGA